MKTFFGIVVFLSCLHSIASIKCMSCSYTFAGEYGTYDRECVSDVYNFTKTRVIDCPTKMCITKAVYVSGYPRLNSLYRGCGYSRQKFCDSPRSLVPTCELTCTGDQCNDGDGDLWKRMKPKPHPHPHHHGKDAGGGATSSLGRRPVSLVALAAFFALFLNKILT